MSPTTLTAREPPRAANPDAAVLCLQCDYPLIGLPSAHGCPECGTPIRLSLDGDPQSLRQDTRLLAYFPLLLLTAVIGALPDHLECWGLTFKYSWVVPCCDSARAVALLFIGRSMRDLFENRVRWWILARVLALCTIFVSLVGRTGAQVLFNHLYFDASGMIRLPTFDPEGRYGLCYGHAHNVVAGFCELATIVLFLCLWGTIACRCHQQVASDRRLWFVLLASVAGAVAAVTQWCTGEEIHGAAISLSLSRTPPFSFYRHWSLKWERPSLLVLDAALVIALLGWIVFWLRYRTRLRRRLAILKSISA